VHLVPLSRRTQFFLVGLQQVDCSRGCDTIGRPPVQGGGFGSYLLLKFLPPLPSRFSFQWELKIAGQSTGAFSRTVPSPSSVTVLARPLIDFLFMFSFFFLRGSVLILPRKFFHCFLLAYFGTPCTPPVTRTPHGRVSHQTFFFLQGRKQDFVSRRSVFSSGTWSQL